MSVSSWRQKVMPRSELAFDARDLRIPGEVARESAMMSPTIPI